MSNENVEHATGPVSHVSQVNTTPVGRSIKKTGGRKKGCFVLFGCVFLVVVVISAVIAGLLLFNPLRNFLKEKGIISDSRVTTVNSDESDQKKLSFDTSETQISDSTTVDIVKKATPSTVSIALASDQAAGRFGARVKSTNTIGSGFVVDKQNGYIVTNQHVACVGSTKTLKVITSDNKVFNVKEIYEDENDDLAILQLDLAGGQLPSQLTLSSGTVSVGQSVIAIGNPSGLTGTVSTGVLSGVNRNIQSSGTCKNATIVKDYFEVFQTDAAINPGNSGGPLLNIQGEVIGVNSATGVEVQNISFSVPVQRVIRKLEELKKFGKLKNPFMGVSYTVVDEINSQIYKTPQGAYVDDLVATGPAAKAGIKEGDTITEISGRKINFSLVGVVSQFNVGDTVKVKVIRSEGGTDKELTFDVVLADKADFQK